MRIRRLLILLAVLLALLVLGIFDPQSSGFFPKCPFLLLTGLKCPGCGTQRALHQLLNLDLCQAFRYNALMVMSIPLLAFLISAEALKVRFPKLYRIGTSPVLSWSILAAVVSWWVLRNIFGW